MRVAMRLGKVGTAGKAADARCVESQEPHEEVCACKSPAVN